MYISYIYMYIYIYIYKESYQILRVLKMVLFRSAYRQVLGTACGSVEIDYSR